MTNFYLVLAGFTCGFALANEYPAIFGIALLHLYTVYKFGRKKRWRDWLLFVGGSILGVLPLLLYNELAFGKLTYVPYEGYADPNAQTFAGSTKRHPRGSYTVHRCRVHPDLFE